ncbi:FecR family protein [Telluribacter sp. SYSU D00476]|uniref:FecR family protein n=1 Tax=Telluribacter sp. SYSU D00476 TaxID=2811430 RepID=UPI001FF30812|nr:FecR domain-containing protein [Telluribacter sp. SYSU D00476]
MNYLLERQSTGQATEEESAELDQWYAAPADHPNFTDQLSEAALSALEVKLLSNITTSIDLSEPAEESQVPVKPLPASGIFTRWYWVAAVFVGILLGSIGIYHYYQSSSLVQVTTDFGEIKTFVLPDGTEVVLNGNSELVYAADWEGDLLREVQLKGEAFFKVVHTRDHRKFRVNTTPDFSVDVLGTQFLVTNRASGKRVVLNEGKVQCNLKKDTLLLKPGELVQFASEPSRYVHKQVDPSLYSSWTDHRLVLKNTSLKEISEMLAETYGLEVVADNPALLQRQVSGAVPMDDVSILLEGIASTCNLTIRQEEKTIYLTDKQP